MYYQPRPESTTTTCHQCGERLPSPASNPREAFCSPGCRSRFLWSHCYVCHGALVVARKSRRRRLCGRRKCQIENRRLEAISCAPARVIPLAVSNACKNPAISTAFLPEKADRPWRQVAGPELLLEQLHLAVLGADLGRPRHRGVVLFKRATPPLNIVGGHRFPGAPTLAAVFGDEEG